MMSAVYVHRGTKPLVAAAHLSDTGFVVSNFTATLSAVGVLRHFWPKFPRQIALLNWRRDGDSYESVSGNRSGTNSFAADVGGYRLSAPGGRASGHNRDSAAGARKLQLESEGRRKANQHRAGRQREDRRVGTV